MKCWETYLTHSENASYTYIKLIGVNGETEAHIILLLFYKKASNGVFLFF
jgi:hypothetical protein